MKKDREPVETQRPRCPSCDRPLEGINDYPKIKVKDVIVSRIPNIIRDMPSDDNIAQKIRGFAKLAEVQNYLLMFYSLRDQPFVLSDISPDLPEYQSEYPDISNYYKLEGKYYLHVLDTETPNIASVSVMKHVNSRVGWGFTPIAKLAEIHYEGVLKNPNPTVS